MLCVRVTSTALVRAHWSKAHGVREARDVVFEATTSQRFLKGGISLPECASPKPTATLQLRSKARCEKSSLLHGTLTSGSNLPGTAAARRLLALHLCRELAAAQR